MTASGEADVTGVGYRAAGRALAAGGRCPTRRLRRGDRRPERRQPGRQRRNCASADGEWEIQGDPTEAAFLVAERKLGAPSSAQRRFERHRRDPFSSERKMMSTIERDHEQAGARLVTKGAPDVLMRALHAVRVGMDVVPFDDAARSAHSPTSSGCRTQALRTLAVAYRPLDEGGRHRPPR